MKEYQQIGRTISDKKDMRDSTVLFHKGFQEKRFYLKRYKKDR